MAAVALFRVGFNRDAFRLSAGLFLLSLGSALHSVSVGMSLLYFLKVATWVTVFLLAASLGRALVVRELAPVVFLLGGLGACSVGFLMWVSARPTLYYMSSVFYQSDVFAGYLLLLFPLAFSFAAFSVDRSRKVLYLITSFLFVITLFLTGSRGGMVVFVFSFLLWLAIAQKHQSGIVKRAFWVGSLFALVGVFYFLLLHDSALQSRYLTKLQNPASWANTVHARLSFWKGGLEIFAHHPWLGSGPDTFGRLFPMVQERFEWYSRYPHNAYIQMLCEQGVFAFGCFVALILFAIRSGFRALKSEKEHFPIVIGLWIGFVAGALHLLLDVDTNFLGWSFLFWAEAGLLVAFDHEVIPMRYPVRFSLGFIFIFLFVFQMLTGVSSVFHDEGKKFLEQGNFAEALKKENLAIHFYSENSEYFQQRSHIQLGLYFQDHSPLQLRSSRLDLEKALLIDPIRPLYLGELARIWLNLLHDKSQAKACLAEALSYDAFNYPLHRVQLADIALNDGAMADAQKAYEQIIRLFPEDRVAHLADFRRSDFLLALALAHLGLSKIALQNHDMVNAKRETDEALRLAEKDPQVNYFAGLFSLNQKNLQDAAKHFQWAVYDPELGQEPWIWLAYCDYRLRRVNGAFQAIRQAFRFPRRTPDLYLAAASIYALDGDQKEADVMWKELYKINPKNASIPPRVRK